MNPHGPRPSACSPMRRLKSLALLAGTLFLHAPGSLQAQTSVADEMIDPSNGTRVEIQSIFDPMPPSGYAPLRIIATNGRDQGAVWSFDFSSQTQEYRQNNTHSSTFAMHLPGLSTQTAQFLLPLAVHYGNGSSYWNNSRSLSITLNGPAYKTYSHHDSLTDEFPAIAISKPLSVGNMEALKEELEDRKSGRSGGNNQFGCVFKPEEAPEDWLGYSGFDYLLLSDADWQRLKPGAQQALLQWVRFGGQLHFYIQGTRPPDLPADASVFGLGKIQTFTWQGTRLPARETVGRYWKEAEIRNQLISGHTSSWELLDALGERSFNSWQVVVFLVLFGILVGPVNLFVLAPSGRRHRLFFTTPLLSLGASALMVALILVQDGIGGVGARIAVIEVEPQEAAAYVTQKQTSRTGVLFGSQFELAQPALIQPLALPDSPWVRLKNSHDSQPVSLTQKGSSFGGNFFQSRTEQAQMIRTAVSTRARLEVTPATSPEVPPTLVSALGFTLEEMFYADAKGQVWKLTAPLATGQKAALTKAAPGELSTWWLNEAKPAHIPRLDKQLESQPNRFFGKATSAPGFLQETLGSIRWQADTLLVHGSIPPP